LRKEATSANDVSTLVSRAVVAPDISEVGPDRHLELGLPAWDFRNEVLRWLLHRTVSPTRKACSSHFLVPIALTAICINRTQTPE
jgi:hypothetical protein